MSSGGRLGRWLACSQRSPRVLECLYGRPARRARCLPSSSSPSSRPSSYAASAFPPSGHPSPAEMSSTCTKLASRLSRLVSPSAPSPRGSAPTSGCALLCIGTPFRESGPPACMAKLIMLRHKVSPPPALRGYAAETHLGSCVADTAGQHQTAKPHKPSPTSLTYIQRITRPLTA